MFLGKDIGNQMAKMILGIDPGKQGALVFLNNDNINHYQMPLLNNGRVDVQKIKALISFHQPSLVVVERQQIRSGQKGAMAIGENYGRLTGTIDCCRVDYIDPTPQKWQKHFGISGDKAEHIRCCEENGFTVPTKTDRANSPKHDGIADAYLIALYGKQINERKKK